MMERLKDTLSAGPAPEGEEMLSDEVCRFGWVRLRGQSFISSCTA